MYRGSQLSIWNSPFLRRHFKNRNSCQLRNLETSEAGTIDLHVNRNVCRRLRPSKFFDKEAMKIEVLQALTGFCEINRHALSIHLLLPERPNEQMIWGSCDSISSSMRHRRASPRKAITRSASCWSLIPERNWRLSVSAALCCRG